MRTHMPEGLREEVFRLATFTATFTATYTAFNPVKH